MKVEELNQSDKEEWAKLYHGYAKFYEMEMNESILDTVWSWIHLSLIHIPSPRD